MQNGETHPDNSSVIARESLVFMIKATRVEKLAGYFGITFYYLTFIIFISKSNQENKRYRTLIVNNVLVLFSSQLFCQERPANNKPVKI